MKNFIISITILMLSSVLGYSQATKCVSPNGKLGLELWLNKKGEINYSVKYEDKNVIMPSKLGFKLNKNFKIEGQDKLSDLNSNFTIKENKKSYFNEEWTPVWGEVAKIKNEYNELFIRFIQSNTNREMDLRFRLYNDGLGMRYEFPDQENLIYFVVKEEETEFALPSDETAIWIPGDYDTEEYNYDICKVSQIAERYDSVRIGNCSQTGFSKNGVQTPLMLKYNNGLYVNIHEAALINFPALNLEYKTASNSFVAHLTPDAIGNSAYVQTSFNTPWRTIIVSDDARDILASKLVYNLNEPSKIEDTSWIKPTKYMGVWWEMITGKSDWAYTKDLHSVKIGETDYSKTKASNRHAANNEKVKRYIDFASKHGIPAMLVEGWNTGWEDWFGKSKDYVFDFVTAYPDFDVKGIGEYAKSKNVSMIMHHETSGSIRNYERHLEKAYQFMVDNNYHYVKSGYVGNIIPRGEYHYGQYMVNHYLYCITEAAKKKIMVNAHESVHMTGLSRTYPNLLSQESAKGQEYQSFGGNNPNHMTILPFTRLIGGPMDYTPGILEMDLHKTNPDREGRVNSTICNQLATYLTMYSPLQMAADLPENYEKYMDAFEFIKAVPVEWQDSKYLEAEPGEYITVARKDKYSENWFIGSVSGVNRKSTIKLDFLNPNQKYIATIYQDNKDSHYYNNPESYSKKTIKVKKNSILKLNEVMGGGYAIEIKTIN